MYIGTFSEKAMDNLIERIKKLKGRAMGSEEELKKIARFDHVVNSNMGNISIECLDRIVAMVHLGYPEEHIKYHIDLKLEEEKREEEARDKAARQLFDIVQREIKELQGKPVEQEEEDAWEKNTEIIKLFISSELKPYFTDDQLTDDAVERVFDVLSKAHKYAEKYGKYKLSDKEKMDIRFEIRIGIAQPVFRRNIIKAVCGLE